MPTGSVTPAGGAAFNGGTITQPLEIDPTTDGGLTINANPTQTLGAVLLINDPLGAEVFHVGVEGSIDIGLLGADQAIDVAVNAGHTTDILAVGENFAPFAYYWRLEKDGYMLIAKNSAPADAQLRAGELNLWLDATNGASKLMVKAKSADGTVVTAAIALA